MDFKTESSPFLLEFYQIGQFAKRAAMDLRQIDLFRPAGRQSEALLVTDPADGAIEPPVRQALLAHAASSEADPLNDGRHFVLQLSLPEGGSFGAICFERREGAWSDAERSMLESVASVYAYSLRAEQDRQDASLQNWVWNQMMDSTHACIYVTDPETDEILFMNQFMKQTFGLDEPEGQLCWKVLQRGQKGRCAFCPVRMLTDQEQGKCSHVWEEHNPITGRIYENYDSLMPWKDGRLVHFQYSTDVTETRRLYKAAMTDELTGALSRFAGKEALVLLLEECNFSESPICVCMLDVNGLKSVNDLYGHAAGDELLTLVSASVRGQLQGQEYLMRLSGDEFVAVLPGIKQPEAAARMDAALAEFDRARPGIYREESPFCYGVVEVREKALLRDVLARADERMYQQKRSLHIQRAEALLKQSGIPRTEAPFVYDTAQLYDALIKSTDDYVYVCNMKTGIFRYPPAMVREFGLPSEIVPNAAAVWGAKVHPHDKRIFMESNQEIVDGRTDTHCVEYRAQNVRGEWVWLRCRGHLLRDENGEPSLFAGFISNLGKKNKLDPLTGLYNKFELESDVIRLLSGDVPCPLTFLMLGMDGLKRIISLHDRVFGDEADYSPAASVPVAAQCHHLPPRR